MRRFFPVFFLVILFFSPLCAKNVEASLEESLELRRIAEYWKEKDYNTVKIQIREFLNKNPKSSFVDQLHAMLGDLHFQDKNFKDAVASYDKIEGKEFRQKCRFHHLHGLYEVGKYEEFLLTSDLFLKDPLAKAEQIHTIRFELAEIYFLKAYAPENEKKKKELFKAALSEYQQLMQSKFCDMTLLNQAQIHAYFEEYSKAASFYLLLANRDSNRKEEYLFQAASLLLHTDKKAAISTFEALVDMGGKYASKAAFNQLNLLFQEKRYRDFILAQDKALKHIPSDKLSTIQYALGKSFFHTGDYQRAIDPLMQSLAAKNLDRTQEKSALLSLIVCSKEIQDLTLFEKVLSHLKAEFADDEETTHVLLMHAQLCRDKKEWAKARADMQEILALSPHHPQREALVYDRALLLAEEGKWQEGASGFASFMKEFPASANRLSALRHIVNCRLQDVQHASKETERVKKEQLLSALAEALKNKGNFSTAERQKIRYLLGKTQFELGQYDEAIVEFGEYVRDFQKDPTCSHAYLLLAYSYQKGSNDAIHFTLNAEKALSLNPHLEGAIELHLTLFNTYLALAGKAPDAEKAEMIEKGADHLFLSLGKPISKENLRWLAGYYFQQHQNGRQGSIERAAIVLEKLLNINPSSPKFCISSESLDQETEAIKLSDAYQKMGRMKERLKLLEALTQEHNAHPDYHWKYQRMTSFELGKTYLALGEKERALETFNQLISSSSHISSYFALAAQLEKAKLQYALLSKRESHEDSKTVLMICDTLKEVQLKRKLHSEPIHLEAALCYIDIKSDLAPRDQKKSKRRLLLQQMKESFLSEEDPLVKQYLMASSQFPEKERLLRQYITFVDIELLRLRTEDGQDTPLLKEANEKLDHLLREVFDETLSKRIQNSKAALEIFL